MNASYISTYTTALYKHNQNLVYLSAETAALATNVLIVRGIGYRAFVIENDFLSSGVLSETFIENTRPIYTAAQLTDDYENTSSTFWEFNKVRYLVIRAGHTRDLYAPINKSVKCQTKKKDRKLSISSVNSTLVKNLTAYVYNYRKPSAYTGRGVRRKHEKPMRKAGKKDKQRGRAF